MKKSFYGHGSRSRFTVVKLLSTLIVLAAIVPSLSCLAAEKAAENLFKKDAPIDLTADNVTYDKTTNTYHAKGNVIIVQEGTTLKTDEAMINMESGAAYASGKVIVLDEGGNDIKADEMKMNMKEKTIVLARGRLFYKKENIHLNADVIRKTGKETYEAQRLTYTTCDCPDDESPAWNFYARDAQLTVGEYLTGWHSFFEIKGVPVLYTPYISVPIKRDRQTGFLQPKPGYSKLRGFVLKNSFFWAISRNTDATLYLDEETRRGLGKGSEFRYIRTRSSAGEANFYHFKEKDIDRVREFRKNVDNLARPKNATDDRWRFKLLHNESLFDAGALRANIDMVSDDEYFIDFGKGALERSLESLESNLSYTKNWSIYSLTSQMRFFNNLMTPDDRRTLQMLPAAAFKSTNQTVAGSPLYLSTESNFVNFARQEGATGQRLDLIPRLSLPMRPGEWFDLTPYAAPRATFYSIKDDPNGRYFDRYLYEAGVNSATTFLRVYLTDFEEMKALRHTIRPTLTYSYIPEAIQTDLPKFDSVDSIAQSNLFTYGLNMTLTGKFGKTGEPTRYHNYAYLDLSQSYDINEATRKLLVAEDERRPFKPVIGELRSSPASWASLTAKGVYDVNNNWFTSYDASADVTGYKGMKLSASHRFTRGQTGYLEVSARSPLIHDVDITYLKRFSVTAYKTLETSYGLNYRHQCWSYALSYTERPEEKIVYLTFNLLGLGRVAGVQGRVEPN